MPLPCRPFLASATNPGVVVRLDVMLALGREYQKLGRPVTRADFGDRYERVTETLFAGAAGGSAASPSTTGCTSASSRASASLTKASF